MITRKTWNPIKGTIWLPPDIKLAEIDFEPLPEDGDKPAFPPACAMLAEVNGCQGQ